jgi:hypothetical protein
LAKFLTLPEAATDDFSKIRLPETKTDLSSVCVLNKLGSVEKLSLKINFILLGFCNFEC